MTDVTKQQVVDALWREGDYWNQSTITYSIPTSSPADSGWDSHESNGFQALTYGQTVMAAEAFELWDDLIATSLVQNTTSNANITLAYTAAPHLGGTGGYTHTDANDSDDYVIGNAKIWINANSQDSHHIDPNSVDTGSWGYMTYIHEIGHALGLTHPGTYNGPGDWTYAQDRGFD